MRSIGTPRDESVSPMSYLDLQSIGDENHHHGKRRYSAGHYLPELSDAAIDAFLSRGVAAADGVDWTRVAAGGFQAYGGAIGEVSNEDSAFSHRATLVEFFAGQSWTDPAEDEERMASARAFGAALEPFATGSYVNALAEQGEAQVLRAYGGAKLARLAAAEAPLRPGQRLPPEPEHRPGAVGRPLQLRGDAPGGVGGPWLGGRGIGLLELGVAAGEEGRQLVGGDVVFRQRADPVFDGIRGIPSRPILVVHPVQLGRLIGSVSLLRLDEQRVDCLDTVGCHAVSSRVDLRRTQY